MTFVDVFVATLKINPCFESKTNIGYGATMFRLLLLISCLVFVVGCGDESEAKPKIWVGNVWVGDLDGFVSGGYTVITGSLIILGRQIDTIDMPLLEAIGGDVDIVNNNRLTSIYLPQLQAIGGEVNIKRNENLTTLTTPQLELVGGRPNNHHHATTTISCRGKSMLVGLSLLYISTPQHQLLVVVVSRWLLGCCCWIY